MDNLRGGIFRNLERLLGAAAACIRPVCSGSRVICRVWGCDASVECCIVDDCGGVFVGVRMRYITLLLKVYCSTLLLVECIDVIIIRLDILRSWSNYVYKVY